MKFELLRKDRSARLGRIQTAHGVIDTPVFMPVGTAASVKALTIEELKRLGPQIILNNTYHLMLRPGIDLIAKLGGVHKLMNWDRAVLSDSGGFQVWSLASMRKVREEGVEFRSHLDGSLQFLSPEVSVDIQSRMGVDIAMAFDECPAYGLSHAEVEESMERTHRWARRSLGALASSPAGEAASSPQGGRTRDASRPAGATPARPARFGIVQGGVYPDLRTRSAEVISAMDFDGVAIGGVSVGETKDEMLDVMRHTAPLLPEQKPRYLMGVGTPQDLLDGVAAGIDMFDCVMPTRNARNGTLFTSEGKIAIKNARFADDQRPLDPRCACTTCRTVSRAYLRHLYVTGEIAALVYNTIHNVFFYLDLMARVRQSIALDSFGAFRETFLSAPTNEGLS
ncbi:MAG TPA: tRNA guanosine(34) transglycosylase Tgt [Thermoanaerobaculia bacterium]|nr:tRNA guanosine(34) transglycosylase Tgt [Thermoanaerobaculia bacterium]